MDRQNVLVFCMYFQPYMYENIRGKGSYQDSRRKDKQNCVFFIMREKKVKGMVKAEVQLCQCPKTH